MIKFISSNSNNLHYREGKAWPNYEEIANLHDGIRIIRNGMESYVYALIDNEDNIIIPYTYGLISAIPDTDFLKISDSTQSEIHIFNSKGTEILSTFFSRIEFIDNVFIVSKSNNMYGQDRKELYGIYSDYGDTIYPVEYDSIEYIAPHIFKLTKLKKGFFRPTVDKNILWFALENKEIEIPLGNIQFLNGGASLVIYPSMNDQQSYETGSSAYMLLSSSGVILSPNNTLKIGLFNEVGQAHISVKSDISGIGQLHGTIDWNGNLYIHCQGSLMPMPSGYDWVSDFKNGIADTFNGKNQGHINLDFQKVVQIQSGDEKRYVLLPAIYSYAIDSEYEYIQVVKEDLMGIIDSHGKEIIPTIYTLVDIIYDSKLNLYRFICYRKDESEVHENYRGKYGVGYTDIYDNLGNKLNSIPISNPVYLGFGFFRINCEEEKIKRIRPNYNGEFEKLNFQIINSQCNLISELKFSEVLRFGENRECSTPHMEDEDAPYAIFMRGDTWGAMNSLGEIVLQGIETWFSIKDIPSLMFSKNSSPQLFNIEDFKVPFNHNYKSLEYVGYGLFLATTDKSYLDNKWDKEGSTYVDIFNHQLAPASGRVSEIKNNLFISTISGTAIYLRAVINIHGEIIIPYSNYDFEIHNNFILAKNRSNTMLYSLNGNIIVSNEKYRAHKFEDFLDRFIKITFTGWMYKNVILIDLTGKVIYDNEYCDYELILPGLLKIKKYISDEPEYFLGDFYGNILTKGYLQIDIYKNGLCRVCNTRHTGYNEYSGNPTYSRFYGVIKITGEEVIPIKYRSVEIFEKENLIKTSVGDMTYNGRFITFYDSPEGKTQLILDAKYDYCLPFDNEYAITYVDNKCGIIDTLGKEIFPIICSKIVNIKKYIYKLKINGLWGIFDINRGLIIPNRYYKIEDFDNNIAKVIFSKSSDIRYYGLISLNEELIKPIYSVLRILTGTVVACAYGGEAGFAAKWCLFNIDERQTINLASNISYVGNLSEGLIRICIDGSPCRGDHATFIIGGRWGYMNINGSVSITPQYNRCLDFLDNLGPVKQGQRWGFINHDGDIVVPFEYDEVENKGDHYIGIKIENNEKLGYRYDKNGNLINSVQKEEENYDSYQDEYWSEDNSSSIYDNPYYNDNLDMDQQSIDFWNSL